MFRNRQSSQKPSDELFERFRQSFPLVNSTVGETTSNINALQDSTLNRPRLDLHEDADPTPRAPNEPFRFTPSLLDPSSAAFAAFANQPPNYYTPTSGSQNTGYQNSISHDLQAPMLGLNVDTPLVMHNNGSHFHHVPSHDMQNYHVQALQSDQYGNFPPLMPSYVPSSFMQTDFHAPSSPRESPMQMTGIEDGDIDQMDFRTGNDDSMMEHYIPAQIEKFRFHVTLNAPTAMIKHHDEVPITYLNKGQSYSITVLDTQPPGLSTINVRYRTFVRISFQDEGQREKAAFCWQLWKEGRGLNEAHQRGGKLQAVEFVESNSQSADDDKRKTRVEIEKSSFDGFSVIWSPSTTTAPEAVVNVRFNFLSTDFSHSKGVKGIPVRLCAKTEVLSSGSPISPNEQPEVCFCKVKLFRDHGAERKLANDILHVKKTIDKLRQQLHLANDPNPNQGGKKRKDSLKHSNTLPDTKSGKIQKHKRTWSVSSTASLNGISRGAVEDDINFKLSMMQDMFTSTRPVSVLYLRGDEIDDPDLHPIHLPDAPMQDGADASWSRRPSTISIDTSGPSSSLVSPTPSSASLPSQRGVNVDHSEWTVYQNAPNGRHMSGDLEHTVKVKTNREEGGLSGWIDAIGVDSSYVPPPVQAPKPAMSIYILPLNENVVSEAPLYRAVYLMERTQACLTASIAHKCGIEMSQVVRMCRQTAHGISILIDDDVVREMPEGQDMKVQIQQFATQTLSPPQSEWSPDMSLDGDNKISLTKGWELRLFY